MDLEEKVANLGDELARKNLKIFELKLIFPEDPGSQKEESRGARRGPHARVAWPDPASPV
jgi:hypothetical protein